MYDTIEQRRINKKLIDEFGLLKVSMAVWKMKFLDEHTIVNDCIVDELPEDARLIQNTIKGNLYYDNESYYFVAKENQTT